MPIYVYRVVGPTADPDDPETFEIRQSIDAEPLQFHPRSGEPVERVFCPPTIRSNVLGNAALNSTGMTKYVKTSDGSYERQAGSGGPKIINPHDY